MSNDVDLYDARFCGIRVSEIVSLKIGVAIFFSATIFIIVMRILFLFIVDRICFAYFIQSNFVEWNFGSCTFLQLMFIFFGISAVLLIVLLWICNPKHYK